MLNKAEQIRQLVNSLALELHAAEKRAQDAEAALADSACANRLREIREVVGGEADLVEAVRALKTRCEGADSQTRRLAPECTACPGRQAVDELTLKLAEARRAVTAFEDQRDHAISLERDVRAALAACQRERDAARAIVAGVDAALEGRAPDLIGAAPTVELVWRLRVEKDSDRERWFEERRAMLGDLNNWRTRIRTAESALAERNREIDRLRETMRKERGMWSADRTHIKRAEEWKNAALKAGREAASLRAQLDGTVKAAQARVDAAKADRDAAQSRETLALATAQTLRAQVESLRGGDEPEPTQIALDRLGEDWRRNLRHKAMEDLVAALPPPSPKTGRWRCRRCGKELLATAWTGSGSRWALSLDAGFWIHWCEDNLASSPADRIGDAPEVTP